jgi:hypothetical protein
MGVTYSTQYTTRYKETLKLSGHHISWRRIKLFGEKCLRLEQVGRWISDHYFSDQYSV